MKNKILILSAFLLGCVLGGIFYSLKKEDVFRQAYHSGFEDGEQEGRRKYHLITMDLLNGQGLGYRIEALLNILRYEDYTVSSDIGDYCVREIEEYIGLLKKEIENRQSLEIPLPIFIERPEMKKIEDFHRLYPKERIRFLEEELSKISQPVAGANASR